LSKNRLTHLDANGNPKMVDVSNKKVSQRMATAQSIIRISDELATHISVGEIQTKKGPVFQTAILAGIMAVKKTSELIPLCHPISITKSNIRIKNLDNNLIQILSEVSCEGKTGVEMEALTGASIAALTIYDMLKGFSQEMEIIETKLLEKTGGKSDIKRT